MAYHLEKETGDLVINGFERGIAPSPHVGIANLQAVDINTEQGEVMCSYSRQQQNQTTGATGTVTNVNTNTVSFGGGAPPKTGQWITISASTISGLSNGNYYVLNSAGKLSATYSTSLASQVTGMGSGTAVWTTVFDMALAIQGATERYVDTTGATQYRYYIFDANGRLWVRDTFQLSGVPTPDWFLPYTATITSYNGSVTTTACGMAVLCGYVFLFGGNHIFTISTSQLGTGPALFSAGSLLSAPATTNLHYALSTHQDILYYTDGPFVGSIVPDSSLGTTISIPNIQSYCSYTAATTTGTISGILNGSLPTTATSGTPSRIPAFFFPGYGGAQPTNLAAGTKFYIQYLPASYGTFEVYAAETGGSAIDIAAGATGTQYFNTFFPQSSDGNSVMNFTPQRLALPTGEISICLAELGSQIIVGNQSNSIYVWDQAQTFATSVIFLPEAYIANMLTVNNVVYIFAGFRGNIYVTDSSSVSLALTVPDYCTGLIEPYFVWGGAMYSRGRVWFSIQDQTASHTGQCGGVWSFIPVQNFSYGLDLGQALRMDNKNSYNTFNGRVSVFLANTDQQARGPQYWSAWISTITSPVYGIDYSAQVPTVPAVIQTDVIPTGTVLEKKTFSQFEYKLATPLDSSNPESVSISYRTNLSDPFVSLGTAVTESATALSGYFPAPFEKSQWLQLQVTLTPNNSTTSSFVRLTEVRVR